MGIFQNNKLKKQFDDTFKEAENMTEKEVLEANMGYIKVLQQAPGGQMFVCHLCKHYFKSVGLKKDMGIEAVKYMHDICGNPCKKKLKFNSETNQIEKVEK